MGKIDYEYGYSGEIIVLVDGVRVTTVDNWQEYREAKKELLEQNLLAINR
ncbi:MAG TPA: hypothetical protein GXZ90_09910 [Clostridiales bacterium]|nr:hypothetical protein [Clostridiales bacterium]